MTGISNETINELTIYSILCRNVNFSILSEGKVENVQELKMKFFE